MVTRDRMKQATGFRVDTERIDERTVVIAVAGEVDLYTAPELKRELVAAVDQGARKIVVDLSEATFIDSTTLGVFQQYRATGARAGARGQRGGGLGVAARQRAYALD